MSFVRRLIVHLVAIAVAMALFWVLEESIRTGRMSAFIGLIAIAGTYFFGCVLLVIAVGAMTRTPARHWLAMLRQLFGGPAVG